MRDSPRLPLPASADALSAPPQPAARFQILSLDGGGLKGLFAAAVLAKLEEKAGTTVVDHFDLIAGTSTGGLIALGLGLGLSPRSLVEFYVREGPAIFRNRLGLRNALQILSRKFPQEPLARALRSPEAFGEKLFGDSRKPLVIPSYNLSTDTVRVFRTPHIPRLTTDLKIPAWQVGLATTAAPTYFPSFVLGENYFYDRNYPQALVHLLRLENDSNFAYAEKVRRYLAEIRRINSLQTGTKKPELKIP